MKLLLFVTALILISVSVISQPCNMQGIYTVGSGGNYSTLTAAFAMLQNNGVAGPVILELRPGYSGAGETFPLTPGNIPCTTPVNTVTIRPQAGASNLVVSTNGSAILNLDNTKYLIIDGRPGGAGVASQLSLINTSTTGVAINFNNGSQYNTIRYLAAQGRNTTTGVIVFGASTSSGNSYNTIDNCAISGTTAGKPINGILSQGTAGAKNLNNVISNCNISDYYSTTAKNCTGIKLKSHNEGWRLEGNSIYHSTNPGSFDEFILYAIHIDDTTSSRFTIVNNFIGGSAPKCTGPKISYGGRYAAILLNVGKDAVTLVQNNTVSNLAYQSQYSSDYWVGVGVVNGKVTIDSNTVGSTTSYETISAIAGSYYGSFVAAFATGIPYTSISGRPDTVKITNNKFGGVRMYTSGSGGGTICGVSSYRQPTGYLHISGNLFGSYTVPGSLRATTGTEGGIIGISGDQSFSEYELGVNIINNEFVNWYGRCSGINTTGGGRYNIANNLFRKFTSAQGIVGVRMRNCLPGTAITNNELHTFEVDHQDGSSIFGIAVEGSGYKIDKNLVHTFYRNTISSGWVHVAVEANGNNFSVTNNMIRLGRDVNGQLFQTTEWMDMYGIRTKIDSALISNNTVVIDAAGPGEAFCLYVVEASSKPKSIINNIFVNNRPCLETMLCKTICINLPASVDTSNLTLDYNIYYSNVSNAIVLWRNIYFYSISSWRSAFGKDLHGLMANPNLVNATGGVNTINLRLNNPTPAEGTGMAHPWVQEDIDGELRSALSPSDIGADAGNYVMIDVDTPVLSHSKYTGWRLGTMEVYKVKITDNGTGIDTSGNNGPRIWYRKKHPAVTAWFSTKGYLIAGALHEGIWGFTPDLAATGVAYNSGDSIEFYFVAQDKANFVGYSNGPGTNHTSVATQVSAPTNPQRLLVYGTLPDTVYVGVGQPYTSLSNTNGVFHTLKTHLFDTTTKEVTIIITSDLTETGAYSMTLLDRLNTNFLFKTNTPTIKHIRLTDLAKDMIVINDILNVNVNGSVNGTGRFLLFSVSQANSSQPGGSALAIGGAVGNLQISSCIFESTTNSTILYSTGASLSISVSRANNIRITNNLLRQSTIITPSLARSALSLAASNVVDSFIIRDNEFTNFQSSGLYAVFAGPTMPGTSMIIERNHFYHNTTLTWTGTALQASSQNNRMTIRGNYFGGSNKYCSGAYATTSAEYNCLKVFASSNEPALVQNNVIQNIRITNMNQLQALYVQGWVNVTGNLIGSSTIDSSIVVPGNFMGLDAWQPSTTNRSLVQVLENNTVSGIVGSHITGVRMNCPRGVLRNNHIYNALSNTAYLGIDLRLDSGLVDNNRVHSFNLVASTATASCIGINVLNTSTAPARPIRISRNRIYQLRATQITFNPFLAGMVIGSGPYEVENNQISLMDSAINGAYAIYGLYVKGYADNTISTKIRYNSFYIAGNSYTAKPSYGVYLEDGGPITRFNNNLVYNERTSAINKHLAVGMASNSTNPVAWKGATNNLYITADTARVNEWRNNVLNIRNWKISSSTDKASFAAMASDVPSSMLFLDKENGNLNINSANALSWYVNGKGLPQADIGDDLDSNDVRSTSLNAGPTDIGSDEFNTLTSPPVLNVYGKHHPGGADTLSWNGRIIAIITWGNAGTLPTLGEAKWYSGAWPNENKHSSPGFLSSYIEIPATGGSGYTYTLQLFYDSSMLGLTGVEAGLRMYRRATGVGKTWIQLNSSVTPAQQCITATALTNFSDFTGSSERFQFWTGTVSTDWTNAANWSANTVPTEHDNVYIPASAPFSAVIPNGMIVKCKSLSIDKTAALTIGTNSRLESGGVQLLE